MRAAWRSDRRKLSLAPVPRMGRDLNNMRAVTAVTLLIIALSYRIGSIALRGIAAPLAE
jgi:hypothetical protein